MDIERDLRAHLVKRAGAPIPVDLAGRLASRIGPRRPGLRWTVGRPLVLAAGGLAAVLVAAVLLARVAAPGPTASAPAIPSASPASAVPSATPRSSPSQPVSSSAHLAHPMSAEDVILSLRAIGSGSAKLAGSMRLLREDTVFVLYGDGRAIFGPSRAVIGGLAMASDYLRYTVTLDPAQVDTLLRHALDEGRLRDASRSYPLPFDIAPGLDAILSVDADGVSRELFVANPGVDDPTLSPSDRSIRKALGGLIADLEGFPESAVVRAVGGATVYRADRYLAVLDDQQSLFLIDPWPVTRFSPWPLPTLPPSAFHGDRVSGRSAVISPADFDTVAALGNRFFGGVAVLGPDGKRYLIRVRPLLPGEAAP